MLQDRRSAFVQGKSLASTSGRLPAAGAAPAPGEPRVFRIGNDLRIARGRTGWDIDAVAAYLRVRPEILNALEEGRLADLPPAAYTIGFLRTYAVALGLDPDEAVRRYRAEAATDTRKPELSFPAPVPERGPPAGAVVLLGTVLAAVAYGAWYRASDSRPAEERVRQVPARLADLVQPPAALAPRHAPADATPAAAVPWPPQPDQRLPAPVPLPSVAALPVPAPLPVPPTAAAAAIPATGVFGPPLTTTPVPPGAGLPPLPEGTRIVLRARADAWLQVRDRQGPVLLNRVLRTGETWPVPPGKLPAQLLLTTGNAGGTEILVDGQLTLALGNDGAVRRDLPLDPDAILQGRLAPPASAARPSAPKR